MGTLLDVGCGNGRYLENARQQGWKCIGIEASPEAAAVAAGRGLEVVVGDALEIEFPSERFDRVRCAHTLEHVPDPARLLLRLRDAVKDEGTVEVVVPNRRSLSAMLFRRYWYGLDLPRHLYHFSPRDLQALAAKTGLQVVAIHHSSTAGGLVGSIDRVLAAVARREPDRRLRESRRARAVARPLAFVSAVLRLGDVVEYQMRRAGHGDGPTSAADGGGESRKRSGAAP